MNTIYVCDSCGEQHYFEKTWNIDATCPTCGDNLGGYVPEDIVDELLTVINEWAIPSVICLSSFDKEFAQKAMKNILEVIAKTEELKG